LKASEAPSSAWYPNLPKKKKFKIRRSLMDSQSQKVMDQLIADFISKGGVIQICRPKLAPVRRKKTKPVLTIEILREAIRPSRAA